MPFQSTSSPVSVSDLRADPSPTKEPAGRPAQRPPRHHHHGSRTSAARARREADDRGGADDGLHLGAAGAASTGSTSGQAPTDIASAIIAYQRRNARSSDPRHGPGRSRPSRRNGNRDTPDTGSADEAYRDKPPGTGPAPPISSEVKRSQQRVTTSTEAESSATAAGFASRQAHDGTKTAGSGGARRSRQSSGKGVLPDLRAQERSSSIGRQEATGAAMAPSTATRAGGSGRRERSARTAERRHAAAAQDFSSVSRDGRQLFDPRRHDPVRFASQQRTNPPNASIDEHSRHLPPNGTNATHGVRGTHLAATTSLGGSRVESFAASQATAASGISQFQAAGPELSSTYTLSMHVQEIKQLYRRICLLEAKLQQAHRSEADKQRDSATTDGAQPRSLNHDYWLRLAADHRELAELQSSFLEMTLRSDMPESVQELPRTYNLPTRLWQTGFHMMLERLRHSLPTAQQARSVRACGSELLDHLTEFIYFAYAFYTTLFETEKFRVFRRAWIESLGDLARYRMAVAGLAASLSLDDDSGVRNKAERSERRRAEHMRIDDDDGGDDGFGYDRAGFEEPAMDGASIGSDALGDWEFVEKETWRQTARDWYARGLAEAPGVGRLHHHLGILSKNDELRALYHLCRSLTAAHPFASAKETILSLFDHEHQSRRLQGDASVEDLFIYLHGALISRVQLDDFDEVFARLREKMGSEGVLVCQHPLTESTWMVMASINSAGLLQYGAEGSAVLQPLLRRSTKAGDTRTAKTDRGKVATPTAILVNHNVKAEDTQAGAFPTPADAWEDGSEDLSDAGDEIAVIQLDGREEAQDHPEDVPVTLTYAMRLAFFMLEFCLHQQNHGASSIGGDGGTNPYVTEFLTFIFSVIRFRPVHRLVERHMPWQALVDFTRTLPVDVIVRASKDAPPYIAGKYPLPEDWCLRGTAGVGKQTYDRALWKKSCASTSASSLPVFRTETEVLDSEDDELHAKFQTGPSTVRGGDRCPSLEDLRRQRIAFIASRLVKTSRGLELDPRTQTFSIAKPLQSRIARWKAEEERQKLEKQLEMMRLAKSLDLSSHNSLLTQDDLASDTETDDDAGAADGEDEAVRQLRERKRYLKGVLRSTKAILETSAPHKPPQSRGSRPKAKAPGGRNGSNVAATNTLDSTRRKPFSFHGVLPGYTVLLMDTNVLVTPGDLLKQLVESQRWTVVVPLAVVTELDGLKRNANALGEEAARAIRFLEGHIRSHAKWLKVQTSRGNYLCDLSIRSEDMSFGLPASAAAAEEGAGAGAREKSLAARNVDEVILRCLAWQTDHFVDRLALLTAHPAAERLKLQPDTAKAALLTLDRNLRVKAKARGLCGLDEQDIAELMIMTAEAPPPPPPGPPGPGLGGSAQRQREAVS